MIFRVQDLPDSARKPFLLALQLQALAHTFDNPAKKGAAATLIGPMAQEYADLIELAKQAQLVPTSTTTTVEGGGKDVEKAADLLWSIGLMQLRNAIVESKWLPTELDLSIRPSEDPILNAKPKYQGSGFNHRPA